LRCGYLEYAVYAAGLCGLCGWFMRNYVVFYVVYLKAARFGACAGIYAVAYSEMDAPWGLCGRVFG